MLGSIVLVASGLLSTIDIGAVNELRLRLTPTISATGAQVPTAGLDLMTSPYAHFETKSRQFDFRFSYAAQITEPDLEMLFTTPQAPLLFQYAETSASYASRHWGISASEGASFGQMNFSFLTPYAIAPGQVLGGPPPVQLLPCTDLAHCASETVTYGSSSTSAMLHYTHRKTTFSISASYSLNGGLDEPSRALVPLVSVPHVDLTVAQRVTRRDTLVTQGDATAADSTQRPCDPATGGPQLNLTTPNPPLCAPSGQWVGVREVWSHAIARRIMIDLVGGATLARVTVNDTDDRSQRIYYPSSSIDTLTFKDGNPAQPYRVVPYPVFGAILTYTLQNAQADRPALHPMTLPRPAAYVYTRVGPVVDMHYGIIDPRLEVGAAALKRIDERHSLRGDVAFVRSLWGSSLDATYVTGEAEVLRRLDKRIEAGLGLRGAWQHDPFTGEFWSANLFLTFVWHEPRFVL